MKALYIFTLALAGTSIGAVVAALYLQFATRIVAGFKPTYGSAYRASFLAGFLYSVAVSLGFMAGVIPIESGLEINLLTALLFTVIHLCVYSGQLVHPNHGYVGMGRATVIVLVQNVIAVVIWSMGCWALHKPAPLDRLSPQWAALQARQFANQLASYQLPQVEAVRQYPEFTDPQVAQAEAVRRYPELGMEGSKLHREFLTRYRRYQSEKPSLFQNASWPMILAEESIQAVR